MACICKAWLGILGGIMILTMGRKHTGGIAAWGCCSFLGVGANRFIICCIRTVNPCC